MKNLKRWLVPILGALGFGAAASQIAALDTTQSIVTGVLSCLAIIVLAVSKTGTDADQDGEPDWIQKRPRLHKAMKVLVPLAVALLSAMGISMASGCGYTFSQRPPGYSVQEESTDGDAIPDKAELVWVFLESERSAEVIRVRYVQGFGGLYPAMACVEFANEDTGEISERYCGSCLWAEGVDDCRIVPPSPVGE